MLRGISSSPIQLHHKTFPDISNFAYLQVQDSHSNTSPLPYYESSNGRYKRRTKREPTSVSDALSSNITEILESLLNDYDKTERPAYNKGKYKSIEYKCQSKNIDDEEIQIRYKTLDTQDTKNIVTFSFRSKQTSQRLHEVPSQMRVINMRISH